ncbi:MAG: hypothetical protein LQ340_007032 [Diploschistes diacapsis]|nr:MAG: hypothetical protein LQ340_007032 [Diploschistes diacapsis]
MSMQAWDVPNQTENGAFNPGLDPMAFANTPASSNFDYSLHGAQLQRMQNGNMRNGNGSPAGFQHPIYQTTSVIPSKRPLEFTGSPRQASRSQTPQQAPYPGFTGPVNGQTPNPYQHLQHQNSSNTSPSPIMQNQQFNTPAIPQRMQTASPSPFSPAGQSFAPQASPVQSDYGGRVEPPVNGGQPFMHGNPYANGMNTAAQSFTPPPGSMVQGYSGPGPGAQAFNPNAMTLEQQRAFQMKQQNMMRQLQASNVAAQQRHQMANVSPMVNNQNQMAIQQAVVRRHNESNIQNLAMQMRQPEDFARQVSQFMNSRNMPFNKELVTGGRVIPSVQIFVTVVTSGGFQLVDAANRWSAMANALGLPPTSAGDLLSYWQQNLYLWENMYQQSMKVSLQKAIQAEVNSVAAQIPPGRQSNYSQDQVAALHARRPSGASFQTPTKGPVPGQQDPRQVQVNGFSPSPDANQQVAAMQHTLQPQPKPSRVQPPDMATAQEKRKVTQVDRSGSLSSQPELEPGVKTDWRKEYSNPIDDTFKPDIFPFPRRKPDQLTPQETHGGITVDHPELHRLVSQLTNVRPDHALPSRVGNLDLHAVIMGLKSGLPGEVRLALNLLSSLSAGVDRSRRLPPLSECDDLLETLIDCAEAQLDFLADNAAEVSDVMLISTYWELVRCCDSDITALQDVPEFASLEYELEKAAERLLCISTLLRNISHDYEADKELVAEPVVVKFIATVIRYLGTRNNLLRTNRNTLDFTKDVLFYLSNVAQHITFSGKEEALCILQFLLSFAPLPQPTVSHSHDLIFPAYEPAMHRYLPFAVQSLAKLLARGEPNRNFLKSVFAADLASSATLDLLTRAFGLCIAPLPAYCDERTTEKIKQRARFLAQGLLAADSLTSLIPPTEHTLAHAWLTSEDGFAHRLLRVITKVGINVPPNPVTHLAVTVRQQRHAGQHAHHAHPLDDDGHDMITSYGVSILRKLAERAKDVDSATSTNGGAPMPVSEISKKGVLLEALRAAQIDPRLLRQLSAYASLDD